MSGTDGDPGGSFEDRLRNARKRRGLDQSAMQPLSSGGPSGSPWGVGLRVGVEMLAALVVGLAIGWGLDRWLATRPIFLALFALLGGAAGVLNVWRMVAPRPTSD